MRPPKLRIGMQTLIALKKYDESAIAAFKSWVALSDIQVPGEIEVYAWVSLTTNKCEAALGHI